MDYPRLVQYRSAFMALFACLLFLPAAMARGRHTNPIQNIPLSPASMLMGRVHLTRCPSLPAYCGALDRPLDPAGEVSGSIRIVFKIFPHFDHSQPGLETIVATEGGPGYPSTGSASSYVPLFAPFRDRHDLLLVDNRGTGASQAIDCEPVQSSAYLFLQGIADCGATLGQTSDLYGSGIAADDLAAVLDALGIGAIDLYGDSYGTFFSQAFAGRHPERLRAMVLDSAYAVVGSSPWYPEAAPAMRNAFESVCQQSLSCRSLPGDSLARIEALLEALRAHPFQGQAHDGDGHLVTITADPPSLALLAFGNSTGPVVYRDLDAASRFYLEQGDAAPLLRLFAENQLVSQSGAPPFDPTEYSAGLFVAVSCSDYPQVYDMTSAPERRIAQREASFEVEEKNDPDVYGPFSISEFNAIPLDYSVLDMCLPWPVPSLLHPPGQPVPPGAVFTSAPVLVLSGTLDSLTPAKEGAEAAALFSNAQQVLVANSFHVTALDEQDDCASVLVRNFVRDLNPGDTSCAANIAEVRTVPRFAEMAAQLDPATPSRGNQGTAADLRVAAAATLSAGDAVARWWVNLSGSDVGLRGGSFEYTYANGAYQFRLSDYEWVKDVAVSGTMSWGYVKPGTVTAHLSITGWGTEPGLLDITWNDRQPHAMATISGVIGTRKVAATMYAP
jgi:pimeloyl-ACP methyl ester carboxylesterase